MDYRTTRITYEIKHVKRLEVLVFIDWYLPGTKAGGPVRSVANLVDHLSDKVCFSIITTDTDYTEDKPYPDVKPDGWTQLKNGSRVWYCSKRAVGRATFKKLLAEKDYDAIYINGIWSRQFSILPLQLLKKSDKKVIVVVRGMLAKGAMQFGTTKKKAFLSVAKLGALYRNVRFQATTEEEVHDIKQHIGRKANITLLPNLPRPTQPERQSITKKEGELKVLCLARIAVEKNNLYAIERMADLQGEVQLDLCGPIYDTDYWSKCLRLIDTLPKHIKVLHINGVEGDMVPELLAEHHLMFLPTKGENFGHVIFESLSVGRPVLISDRTPWQDLEASRAGVVIPLANTAGFEQKLQQFVEMDQQDYLAWSEGAVGHALRYLEQDNSAVGYLELFSR